MIEASKLVSMSLLAFMARLVASCSARIALVSLNPSRQVWTRQTATSLRASSVKKIPSFHQKFMRPAPSWISA